MSQVEKFETKIYSNDDGWVIWLVTTRTQWDRVRSFFRVQQIKQDVPIFSKHVIDTNAYIDDPEFFVKNKTWYALAVNIYLNRYGEESRGNTFMSILGGLYNDGTLKAKLDEHNKKTKHKLEFLPAYLRKEDQYDRVIPYRDKDAVASVTFSEYAGQWSIKYKATAVGINGAAFKFEESIPVGNIRLRPENISNNLLNTINRVMAQAKYPIDDRKDIVAEINEYFEKGRFAFWHQINQMSKTI